MMKIFWLACAAQTESLELRIKVKPEMLMELVATF
jgi:hypothetical protein